MQGAQIDPEIQEGKFFAVISYISFLCIIALLLKKENKFALFHAKQGLVIFVAEVVVFIVSIIPVLGWFLGMVGFVVFTVFSVWGIVEALQGRLKKLPLVAGFSDKIIL